MQQNALNSLDFRGFKSSKLVPVLSCITSAPLCLWPSLNGGTLHRKYWACEFIRLNIFNEHASQSFQKCRDENGDNGTHVEKSCSCMFCCSKRQFHIFLHDQASARPRSVYFLVAFIVFKVEVLGDVGIFLRFCPCVVFLNTTTSIKIRCSILDEFFYSFLIMS